MIAEAQRQANEIVSNAEKQAAQVRGGSQQVLHGEAQRDRSVCCTVAGGDPQVPRTVRAGKPEVTAKIGIENEKQKTAGTPRFLLFSSSM